MGHKPTVRLGGASVLEMVMLGSSVSLASSLRIGSGEVCWIWQSAGASYLMRVFAKRGSRGYLLESAMICNRVMSYSLLCQFDLYPDLFFRLESSITVLEKDRFGASLTTLDYGCASRELSLDCLNG